jgi:hypothetical protein
VLYTAEALRAELPGLSVLRAEQVSRTVGDATAIDVLLWGVR